MYIKQLSKGRRCCIYYIDITDRAHQKAVFDALADSVYCTPENKSSAAHILRSVKLSSQSRNSLELIPAKILAIVRSTMSSLYWKFQENPLIRFSVIMLKDTDPFPYQQ